MNRELDSVHGQDDVATLLDEVRDSNSMPLEDKVTAAQLGSL